MLVNIMWFRPLNTLGVLHIALHGDQAVGCSMQEQATHIFCSHCVSPDASCPLAVAGPSSSSPSVIAEMGKSQAAPCVWWEPGSGSQEPCQSLASTHTNIPACVLLGTSEGREKGRNVTMSQPCSSCQA